MEWVCDKCYSIMNYSKVGRNRYKVHCSNCGNTFYVDKNDEYIEGDEDFDNEEFNDEESLSVYDAALIWASNGKDEDYMFGYSEDELEDAL
ncbi:MAG TPA: hypothetical protein IAD15_06070 [Candidatus Fimiplasma intestinipullorum]|uniref:Uncharacterized protein n=1 Tax=Candidatus Fimiplasma intestinipullorum TaxID=2840825 RepID=A0A9D1HN63_9FIRM|nr:hypothetical protein [Candidatus Fimiplasma intestinipullorum]